MRTGSTNPRGDFYPRMDEIERDDCRRDLDQHDAGELTAAEFLKKWGAALRAMLQP